MTQQYDPESYWQSRLSGKLDLTTVGCSRLGQSYNLWLYRARFRAVRRALTTLNLDFSAKSLMDIGVGSGAWIPFWQRRGVSRIVGLDITSASVSGLRGRYPQLRFVQGDVGSPSCVVAGEQFDVVTAFDVLFHITDDGSFSNAIANISKLVKLSGWVLMSDGFCAEAWGPAFHEYHRSYGHYLRELRAVGLEPVYVEPIFYTMTPALRDAESRCDHALALFTTMALGFVKKLASRPGTERLNHVTGCSLYLMDGILSRLTRAAPSLKILVAKKR